MVLEVGVALAVLVVALAALVKEPAVEFDGESFGIEEDIDLVAVELDVEAVGREAAGRRASSPGR